jgi:Uma2 family endonuclease
MQTETYPLIETEVIYPESDGQPMADNTLQFQWIVTIKENLEALFHDVPDVFVAGDLLWYPVKGRPDLRRAPDALVVFGRPKGYRGSYQQWKEGDIAPQVVFEVQSPGNTPRELADKFEFYDLHGVEEYYLYDPDPPRNRLSGWLRQDGRLREIPSMQGWTSPHLGIRFVLTSDDLHIYAPDGERFLTFGELKQRAEEAEQQAEQERKRAEQERKRAEQEWKRAEQEHQRAEQERKQTEQERKRAEQENQRAEKLAAHLRAMGIDPDTL